MDTCVEKAEMVTVMVVIMVTVQAVIVSRVIMSAVVSRYIMEVVLTMATMKFIVSVSTGAIWLVDITIRLSRVCCQSLCK